MYIEEQTTQWPNENIQKTNMIYKTYAKHVFSVDLVSKLWNFFKPFRLFKNIVSISMHYFDNISLQGALSKLL
jgi:hypothetical protein